MPRVRNALSPNAIAPARIGLRGWRPTKNEGVVWEFPLAIDDNFNAESKISEPEQYAKTLETRQMNVRTVLMDWFDQARAKERQLKQTHDLKGATKMFSDQILLNMIHEDIEMNVLDHHVLGWAVGEASDDNIQAIASVRWVSEGDDDGTLHNIAKEQGLVAPLPLPTTGMGSLPYQRRPVVYIEAFVTKPTEEQKGMEGDLINGIIDWAAEQGRLVVVAPDKTSRTLQEYYYSLGFRFLNDGPGSTIMVYRGNRIESPISTRGFLLDLF